MADSIPEPKHETARRYVFLALSAATALCGLLRAFGVVDKERVSVDILYFFAVAGVLLVLERVRKLSVGPTGVVTELDPAKLQAVVREAVQPGVQEVKDAVAENQQRIDAVSPAVRELRQAVEQNQMMIEGGVMGQVRREELSPTTERMAVPLTARKRKRKTVGNIDGIWQFEPPTVLDDP